MRNLSQTQDETLPGDTPRSLKNWRIDDFSLLAGSAVAAISTTWVIYTALTPATGKTGFFLISYITFLLLYVMTCTLELGKQNEECRGKIPNGPFYEGHANPHP